MPSEEKNQEDMLAELEVESEMGAMLTEAMNTLNDREKLVLEKRYLSDDPMQLKDLGEELGVTKQRVAQIEKRALEKMRGALQVAA